MERLSRAAESQTQLLGSLCEDMQSMAEDQELELHCNGKTPLHVPDRLKVRRIAQNLLQKALKYTPRDM